MTTINGLYRIDGMEFPVKNITRAWTRYRRYWFFKPKQPYELCFHYQGEGEDLVYRFRFETLFESIFQEETIRQIRWDMEREKHVEKSYQDKTNEFN